MTTFKSTFQPTHQPSRFIAYMLRWVMSLMLLFLFHSCKKEEVSLLSVQITSPNSNSLHQYGNSIEVAVKVDSEIGIDKIIVAIKDEAGRLALPQRLININNERTTTEFVSFDLSDERLRGGNYYISATAYDTEEQSKSDFRDIRIIGAPVEVEGIFAMVEANGTAIFRLNSDGSWTQVFSTSDHFHRMEVNSYDQVIHLIGDATSGILTLSATNFNVIRQEVIPFGLGSDFFLSSVMDTTNQKLYVSGADHQVYQFNAQGQRLLSYNVPASSLLSIYNNKLLAYSVQNLTQRRLELYDASTGFFRQSLSIADDVIQLEPAINTNQFIYVANNENGEGVLRVFDIADNYLDQWQGFLQNANNSGITAAYRTRDGLMVNHVDELHYYTFNGTDFTRNPIDIVGLSEDKIDGIIYAADLGGVYQLDSQLNTLNFFNLAGTVDVDVIYNK